MTRRDSPPLPRLAYTVAEAAELTGLSIWHIYDLCRSGDMPSRKIGRRVLIRRADLEEWLDKAAAS